MGNVGTFARRIRHGTSVAFAVLIGVSALALPASAGSNLVKDGSFEKPQVPSGQGFQTYFAPSMIGPWHVSAGSVDVETRWQHASGFQSVDMSGEFQAGTIYQDIATVPGTTYRVRFHLACNPTVPPERKTLIVKFGGVSKTYHFAVRDHDFSNMGWVLRRFDVVATKTSTRLEFRTIDDSAYGPAIDAVSVTVVAG